MFCFSPNPALAGLEITNSSRNTAFSAILLLTVLVKYGCVIKLPVALSFGRLGDLPKFLNRNLGFSLRIEIFLIFLLFISACSRRPYVKSYGKSSYEVEGEHYYPITESKGFTQEGIASWYGKDFHGKTTANGEIYDMHAKTAAHKTLPLGTYVKVSNLENSKTIIVRINDRGPFVRGRIIDLSYAAAQELGIDIAGTASVRIEALDNDNIESISDKDFNQGKFTIQIGSFKNKDNAERLLGQLKRIYSTANMVIYNSEEGTFYRIRVGNFNLLDKADEAQEELEDRGYKEAMVIAE